MSESLGLPATPGLRPAAAMAVVAPWATTCPMDERQFPVGLAAIAASEPKAMNWGLNPRSAVFHINRYATDISPWPRRAPALARRVHAQRDEATVACQKSGMYPTFDSAAGMGQIPLIPGFIPYLILMVAGFDSAAGPIPGKGKHWGRCCAPASGGAARVCVCFARRELERHVINYY